MTAIVNGQKSLPVLKNTPILMGVDCEAKFQIKPWKERNLRVLLEDKASLSSGGLIHSIFLTNFKLNSIQRTIYR